MATPKFPRRLERRHLPYIVHRRIWAQWLTFAYAPLLVALSGFLIIAVTSLEMRLLLRLFLAPAAVLFLFAAMIALDRSFRYRVIIDHDSVTISGLLFVRRFTWGEITGFRPRHNFRLPGYFASWSVDGSNHPRRHWSSLWFGFYEVPPLMAYGGKELTRLLRHAQRRASAGWPEKPKAPPALTADAASVRDTPSHRERPFRQAESRPAPETPPRRAHRSP